jgi:hypothetical protein
MDLLACDVSGWRDANHGEQRQEERHRFTPFPYIVMNLLTVFDLGWRDANLGENVKEVEER